MSDPKIVVVSGTDTEIGKTLVACGVARALVDRGLDVRAVKPVESGTQPDPSPAEDGLLLAEAAGQPDPPHAFVRLREPLAPPVAAEIDDVELDMDDWCERIRNIADEVDVDVLLVEGAGGLLSPLTWSENARDLAERLDASVLLVAVDELGTLNHTLLAAEALRRGDLELEGVVFSTPAQADSSTGRNAETFRRFSGIDRVATLPRVADWKDAAEHLRGVSNWIYPG
ncbi:MAG: dethiobiotin synthase [Myxococcota bacterium]